MIRTWWHRILNRKSQGARRTGSSRGRRRTFCQLRVEGLEVRFAPAAHTWSGGAGVANPQWSNALNWSAGGAVADMETDVQLTFPAGAAIVNRTSTNDRTNIQLTRITFDDMGYTVGGNAVTVPAAAPGIIANNATGANTINLAMALAGATTVNVVNAAATVTLGGILSGAGGLTKVGAGTVILSGPNTYTGATTINAGTLRVAGGAAIANAGAVVLANVAGAIMDLNGTNETIGSLAGGGPLGGNVTLGAGTLTVGDATTTTYSGVISGAGGLTKQGAGVLILGGVNTYTGATTINAGTLRVGIANALADTTAVTLANVAGAILDLNGLNETIGSLAGGGPLGGNVTLGAGTLTVGDATTTTYSGVISGAGGLTKQGAGVLILGGVNTYTGATTINAGTLRVGIANALADTTAVVLANVASAILDLNGLNETIGSLAGGGPLGGNVTLGAGTLTVGDATTTTFNGLISGTGGLTKQGAGVLILGGANTYSGTTTINAGTLRVAGGAAIANTGAVVLANVAGAILDLNGTNETIGSLAGGGPLGGNVTLGAGTLTVGDATTTTFNGIISGFTGGLTKQGAGVLILGGANTYDGTTTINAGTLRVAGGAAISNFGMVVLANVAGAILDLNGTNETIRSLAGGGPLGGNVTLGAGTLTVSDPNPGSTNTFSGVISGTGGLTKVGIDVLILGGVNTYTGATTIIGGTLRIGIANALADTTAVTLSNNAGAILDLNGLNETIGSLAGGGAMGGNVTLGAGTLTVGDATTTTYNGVISGTGGLTKQGAGVLILGGANTYTGATTINAGTLRVAGGAAIANTGAVTLANVAGAIFDLNGTNETIGSLAGGGPLGGNVTLGAGTLTVGDATTTTYSGVISGTGGLTKQGAGVLILGGVNTYTGATAINAGTLRIGIANALADTTAVTLANVAGALLDLNGLNETIGSLAGGGPLGGNVTLGAGTLTVGDATTTTFSGIISGTGSLTKVGAGTLVLGGTNTFGGAGGTVSVNGGVLSVSTDANLGNAANTVTLNTGTLRSTGTFTTARNVVLAGPGTIEVAGAEILTANGVISGAFSLTKSGAVLGTLVLGGTNTFGGAGSTVSVNGGLLSVSTDANLGNAANTVTLSPLSSLLSTGTFTTARNVVLLGVLTTIDVSPGQTLTANGVISGTFSLVKGGPGTLVLGGINTYTGDTTINAGTLRVAGGAAIANTGAVLLANVAGAVLDLNGTNETIGSLAGGGPLGGNVTLGAGTLTVGDAGTTTYSGVISGTGGFTKQGAGVLILGGVNTYTGATTINAGTLRIGVANALADATAATLANVAGAILDLNGLNETIGSLAGGGAMGGNVTLGAGTLTVGDATNTTFGGIIGPGAGGLTKVGTGTLTLSGVNTYAGATAINAGTVFVNGSTAAASAVAVGMGGTLGGTGTVNGAVNVASMGTLSPGSPTTDPGTLGSGNLALVAGATYVVQLNGTGAGQFDQVNVTGMVNLGNGTLTATAGFTAAVGNSFTIINNDLADTVTGTFNGLAQNAEVMISGQRFRISYTGGDGNDVVLTRVADPLPPPPPLSGDPNVNYVNAMYRSVLGRNSDPGGLTFWTAQLRGGASQKNVALGFWNSPEHRGQQVDAYYRRFFNRAPGAAARTEAVNLLIRTNDETRLVINLLTSQEYINAHSTSQAYVQGLYKDVLFREGSASDVAFWVNQLNNNGRQAVALAFFTSTEAFTNQVVFFYREFMQRAPDPGGEQFWISQLIKQQDGLEDGRTDVATSFGSAPEFFSKAQSPR